MSSEEGAASGATDAQEEKTPEQKRINDLEEQLRGVRARFTAMELSRYTWRVGAVVALVLIFLVGGLCYARPWEKSAASQQPFKLADTQLWVPDGTIALLPPEDTNVAVFENFVHSAVLEARGLYAEYLKASGVPGDDPVVYSVSSTLRQAHQTLCLAQAVVNNYPYAFFCADDKKSGCPRLHCWEPEYRRTLTCPATTRRTARLLPPRQWGCTPTARRSLSAWQNPGK